MERKAKKINSINQLLVRRNHSPNSWSFIVPDSESHLASGEIIFDNDAHDTLATNNYYYITLTYIHDTLLFENTQVMNTTYTNNDIILSKLKFFGMKYLNQKGINDFVMVRFKNGKVRNVIVKYLTEDNVEVDLSNLNAKFTELEQIKFFKNN